MADRPKIVLSEVDTRRFNEIISDKNAANQVYDRASSNYHNSLNEINKSEMLLWQHLSETYGFDLESGNYDARMDLLERRFVIQLKNSTEG